MLQKSESTKAILKALLALQSEIEPVIKDANNPFFKSKYADLPSCWAAVQDLLKKNDLVLVQTTGMTADFRPTFSTFLFHVSGEFIGDETLLILGEGKITAQAYGSAVTYYRRYGMSALLGLVADEDDDGNKASESKPAAKPNPAVPASRLHDVPSADKAAEQAKSAAADRAKAELDNSGEVADVKAWAAIRAELKQFDLGDQPFHQWTVKTLRKNNRVVPDNMADLSKANAGYLWKVANYSNKEGELKYELAG